MGWQLDSQILLGDGTGNNVKGLLASLDFTFPPGVKAGKDGTVPTWALSKQMGYGALDGLYARTEGDLRTLLGKATFDLLRTVYHDDQSSQNRETGPIDGIDILRGQGVPVSESFQIPEPGTDGIRFKGQSADVTKKTQAALINMEPEAAMAPVWQGITMIRDPYSNAGEGQVILTANMLYGMVMRRTDGWRKYGIRTEA